jgi:hypothetical protein
MPLVAAEAAFVAIFVGCFGDAFGRGALVVHMSLAADDLGFDQFAATLLLALGATGQSFVDDIQPDVREDDANDQDQGEKTANDE